VTLALAALNPLHQPIRFHHLKAAGRTAKHGREALLKRDDKPTQAMILGKAVHALLLGGSVVIAFDGKSRRGKGYDEFSAKHEGKIILVGDEPDRVDGMAREVEANADARALLEAPGAVHERTLLFDKEGRAARTTPDIFTPDEVTELKTSADVNPAAFPWLCKRMGYHAQVAYHIEGVTLSGLGQPSRGNIIAVEQTPPYIVQVYRLPAPALDAGARQVRLWWARLRAAELAGVWQGYSDVPIDLELPEESLLNFDGVEASNDDGEGAIPF
jgi:hypothetical protein